MQLLQTLLAFGVALGILITFHELGHYWVARRCGIKVLRFSIGFGKPIWVRRYGPDQTEWAVAAIPLGGYVKMLDEREGDVSADELHRAFNRQPVGKRILVVLAGPVANLLLAIALFWVLFMVGVPELKPILGDIPYTSPAASAGFKAGDEIRSVNGVTTPTWQAVRLAVMDGAVERGAVVFDVLNEQHEQVQRRLDFSGLGKADLDSDIMQTIGLSIYRHLPKFGYLDPKGEATRAGLKQGDELVSIDGVAVRGWDIAVKAFRQHPAEPLQVVYRRGAQEIKTVLVPKASSENGVVVGKIGASPMVDKAAYDALMIEVRYGPVDALVQAVHKTVGNAAMSLKMFWKMITGDLSVKNLSGPVTIADYAGQAARMGLDTFVEFLAWVSISLGVLNLLPIPLLDGGHLMYYTAELIRGRPMPDRVMEAGQRLGMALLLGLMLLAFYNDINRLFAG